MVIAGDGDGMVDASVAGLLDRDPLVFYSAGFAADTDALRAEVERGATLVVTDSNRDRARRWSTITDTEGYTEGPGRHPLDEDLSDARLDLFPDARPDAYTTTELVGVKGVAASSYGNPITYTPGGPRRARVRRRPRRPRGAPARSTTCAATGSGSCSTSRSPRIA